MRHTARLFAIALAFAVPSGLFAQAVFFKNGNREERWPLNDPFAPKTTKPSATSANWKTREITLASGGVERSLKFDKILRIEWNGEPAPLSAARDQVARGEPETALGTIEPVLHLFEPVRKVPGSFWLKAAEVKLDALSGLSNTSALSSFITTLEQEDDGSVPGLPGKIKLAKLSVRVRAGENAVVVVEADKLIEETKEPEILARLCIIKADAQLALRKYEEALNTYLYSTVFYGSEKSFLPVAYLGAAKALRGLDTPLNHEQQRNDLASAAYLRDIIRDFPVSKEAVEAKSLLPREERIAEEKRAMAVTEVKADSTPDSAKEADKKADAPANSDE